MVNILRLTVAYLKAIINVKPETQNQRLQPTGLAKPGETRGLTGTGPGLARQESAGRVVGRFWNRTDPFLRSKPGPLAGYPDPLLTLVINRPLSLNQDRIKEFISEHISGLIRIYIVRGVKDERAWDHFYDIIFLDPVTTCHFSQS